MSWRGRRRCPHSQRPSQCVQDTVRHCRIGRRGLGGRVTDSSDIQFTIDETLNQSPLVRRRPGPRIGDVDWVVAVEQVC